MNPGGILVMETSGATRTPEYHRPVLLDETLDLLQPRPGGRYFDGTLGGGGTARAILSASSPDGRLWGVDLDPEAVDHCTRSLAKFRDRIDLRQGNFSHPEQILGEEPIDGAVLDLGLSGRQIDDVRKGFTHREESPLDMRFDPRSGIPAETVLNTCTADQLADIFHRFGEERHSRRIARAIVRAREEAPISGSLRLRQIVTRVVPGEFGRKSVARIFQALRIHVNGELESLELGLGSIFRVLGEGGRLAVVSYHSLEDRIVKRYFRFLEAECICPIDAPECRCGKVRTGEILTRRPIRPSPTEVEENPRSRSARLRAVRKVEEP